MRKRSIFREDDMDTAGLSPADHLKQGVKAACLEVLDDDTLSAEEKVKKIRDYLKAHEKLADAGDDDDTGDLDDEDDLEDDDEPMIPGKKAAAGVAESIGRRGTRRVRSAGAGRPGLTVKAVKAALGR